MILFWADHEGDPVAVDSAAIVGISVGTVNGPRPAGQTLTVTLIWARAVAQPFMVAASFAEVVHRWEQARGESLAVSKAHPTAMGWQAQYPNGVIR